MTTFAELQSWFLRSGVYVSGVFFGLTLIASFALFVVMSRRRSARGRFCAFLLFAFSIVGFIVTTMLAGVAKSAG